MVDGSSWLEVRNNKRATAFLLFFLMVHARGHWYCLSLSLTVSHCLIVTSKIIIRKTYIKELLQIIDVIIFPHTQKKKMLETLTDRATYRLQQHKHSVQMHLVTVSLVLRLMVSSTTNCATERDHAALCLREPKLYSFFRTCPALQGLQIQASATGVSSATMTINYDSNSLSWHPPFFRVKHKTESSDRKVLWNSK